MILSVNNISKSYESQKALDSISFEIKEGEIVGFLGPNGAGKSTLMKILTNYIEASEGNVTIDGIDISKNTIASQKLIGYLPEHNPLYKEMYIKEYLGFIADIHKIGKNEILNTIEKVGLSNETHKKIKELSKGYQQRVGLAAAILHNPDILILDEPITGLDPNQLIEIRKLIKEIGKEKIVLFSTHILQEVEAICNRVLIIKKGKIVADEKLETLKENQKQVIEVTFDFQIEKRFFESLPHLDYLDNMFDTTWELTFDTKEDMSSKVFDFAIKNGLKIMKMNSKNKNLESLFSELTN